MLTRGIPETVDEAHEIVGRLAEQTPNHPNPTHWPHSQMVALAQLAEHLLDRIEELEGALTAPEQRSEAKVEPAPAKRRGRPPKAAPAATVDLVDRVAEHLIES